MYGIIMQNVAEFIQVKFGMERWQMVKEHLNLDWVGDNRLIYVLRRDPNVSGPLGYFLFFVTTLVDYPCLYICDVSLLAKQIFVPITS
jgi:hypothetical protein